MITNAVDSVRQAIVALADHHDGFLTADLVVAAAADPDSPLHDQFTWDDAAAGEAYRLNEARALMRRVKIEYICETRTVRAPYLLRAPDAGRAQAYQTLPRLASDPEAMRLVLLREFRAAGAALDRARAIALAAHMGDEIATLESQVAALVVRTETLDVARRDGAPS